MSKTARETLAAIDSLAVMTEAAIPLYSALRSIADDTTNSRLKKSLNQAAEMVDGGAPLAKAFKKTKFFKPATIELIKAGEKSGNLSNYLRIIALQRTKDEQFRSQVRSAMTYPILVLTIAVVVGVGVSWFILPKLTGLFDSLQTEIPLPTQILIATGNIFQQYGIFIVLGTTLFILGTIALVLTSKKLRGMLLNFGLRVPGVGKLLREVEIARFSFNAGTLIEAGIPVQQVFQMTTEISQLTSYQKFYGYIATEIEQGKSIKKIFEANKKSDKLIPKTVQSLIFAGENTGTLAKMFMKVANQYEEKVSITSKNLAVYIEPLMLFIIWFFVVGLAVSIILPIYSLIGSFN